MQQKHIPKAIKYVTAKFMGDNMQVARQLHFVIIAQRKQDVKALEKPSLWLRCTKNNKDAAVKFGKLLRQI